MTLDQVMHAIGWIAIALAGTTAIGIIACEIIPQWHRIVRHALGHPDLPRASGGNNDTEEVRQ